MTVTISVTVTVIVTVLVTVLTVTVTATRATLRVTVFGQILHDCWSVSTEEPLSMVVFFSMMFVTNLDHGIFHRVKRSICLETSVWVMYTTKSIEL